MKELQKNGDYVDVNGHRMHVYRTGNVNGPKLVFMSGSSTFAPAYDFKALYEKLQDAFRIIVIEKFGYGYSDLCDAPCDVDSMVNYQREALQKLGEEGPFVLLPHSMGGVEAIRWIQMYPEEIRALIGLDMTSPVSYAEWTDADVASRVKTMRTLKKLKLHWLSPLPQGTSFTPLEKQQLKLLRKRNAFNECYFKEAECVKKNASYVGEHGLVNCPALLFSSDGKQTFKNWIQNQTTFASQIHAELICYDCGHYLHYYKSEDMSATIRDFILQQPIKVRAK